MAVAVALRGREGGAAAELGDEVQNCLRAKHERIDHDGETGVMEGMNDE